MNRQFLATIKNKLVAGKRKLIAQIKRLMKIPEFGSDVDSLEEETSESEEYGNRLAVAQDIKNRLADVDSALLKMKKGKYGICEKCKKRISSDVLKIDPESRLCQKCKKDR